MQWLFGICAFALLIMLNSTDHLPNEHLIHMIRLAEVAALQVMNGIEFKLNI